MAIKVCEFSQEEPHKKERNPHNGGEGAPYLLIYLDHQNTLGFCL